MPLFFSKKPEYEMAPYTAQEQQDVIAAIKLLFEENEKLKHKDIGAIIRVVDSEGHEKKYILRCRVFKNPNGELVAVSDQILGAGSFGIVFLGQNIETREFCVAKQQHLDITEEIGKFNGIYADEYKSQTFVVKPKLNVPLWLGFMPFFNGAIADDVGYAGQVPERELRDLVFFEPDKERESKNKRVTFIDDRGDAEAAPKKKFVRKDSADTMVLSPLTEEEAEQLGDFVEGNHPIIIKTMEVIAHKEHAEFESMDHQEFFEEIYDSIACTKKNKLKALAALERHFTRLVAALNIKTPDWGLNVRILPSSLKMSELAAGLQAWAEMAINLSERVQTAHEHNYLLKDLKAENTIIDAKHNAYLIDSDAIVKLQPGQTSIKAADMARSGTTQYFSPAAKAEVKFNEVHYTAKFLQLMRKDEDFAGVPPVAQEEMYAQSEPMNIVYNKKSDIFALGETIYIMLLKVLGIPHQPYAGPEIFDNPNGEPALELLNRVLAVITRMKDDSRPSDESLDSELKDLEEILILIKSLNQFDRDKGILPRLFGNIFGGTESENEKMWRAAASMLVAELDGGMHAAGTRYNYKHVVIPGIAEIKRKRGSVFVQLPTMIAEDLDSSSKFDPVLAMLENLNPGSEVVIGNCAQTPAVALKLFEKASALGMQPKYDLRDGTAAAVQIFIDLNYRYRSESV